MTHAAEPPAQDFKRYHGRALRSRLPSPVSAGTMGPNVYRLQWMGQLCAAVAMFSSSLAALPSVSVLSGAPAVLSTLFFIGLQICTGLMFYFGARRRVLTWPSTAAVVLIMLCYASLAPIWAPAYEISPPWLSFLLILAAGLTAMTWGAIASLAVIGWALISLGVYAVQMPAGYPLQAEMVQTTADCLYAILLAMAIPLTLRAADNADTDYSTAIAHAAALRRSRTQCDEQERLDRLIHDNVMAALLDASRAPGPVSKRTRELAMRALSVLEFEEKRATGIATTYVHTLMDELLDALTPWRSRVRFNVLVPDIRPMGHTRAFLPSDTGQALIHAVTESVSNSARHSGAATTFVTMDGGACSPTALNPFGFYLTFEVLDRGKGFQMRSMDSRRLGVRVSIIGNVENAGGKVDVASAPHRGTRIRILWPSDAHPSD